MTVATLIFSNHHLSRINITETDESGDWTVYDHYSVDQHGEIVKLSRMINVLPGDRSVLQTFWISAGKAKQGTMSEKQLSTGRLLSSPKSVWLPELPIKTATSQFPFSRLLILPDLIAKSKCCVQTSGKKAEKGRKRTKDSPELSSFLSHEL